MQMFTAEPPPRQTESPQFVFPAKAETQGLHSALPLLGPACAGESYPTVCIAYPLNIATGTPGTSTRNAKMPPESGFAANLSALTLWRSEVT